jgi:hypothetical protein
MSTSLWLFRKFLTTKSNGSIDASQITSIACYHAFLTKRKFKPMPDNEASLNKFYRCLVNHTGGTDGRIPFTAEEEEAILIVLRKRQQWPCFPKHLAHVGCGFRCKGFHEKQENSNKRPRIEAEVEDIKYHKLPNSSENTGLNLLIMGFYNGTRLGLLAGETDLLQKGLDLLRFILYTYTPVVSVEASHVQALALCARYNDYFGKGQTLGEVFDFARQPKNKIVVQNAESIAYFGNLVTEFRSPVLQKHWVQMSYQTLTCMNNPGQVIGTGHPVEFVSQQGTNNWMEFVGVFDPESWYYVSMVKMK